MKARTVLIGGTAIAAYLAFPAAPGHGTVATLLSAPGPAASSCAQSNVALGKCMAAAAPYHWTGSQFSCLYTLWEGESGWRTNADTRASGLTAPGKPYAYGIPQSYPASKMATAGSDWQNNPATQIRWGLGYIRSTYGSPCSALAAKRASGNQGY